MVQNDLSVNAILLKIVPILLAFTIHEFFHAWTALKFGDPTAKNLGRVSLNPLVHLDVVGTILIFIAGFGWAKPVPVNLYNTKNPRVANFWITAAGPLSNIGLAILFGIVYRLVITFEPAELSNVWQATENFLRFSVYINCLLAIFNLLPIHPLDGSHIVHSLLPPMQAARYDQIRPYGIFILMGLVFLGGGLLWTIIGPPIRILVYLFAGI